MLPKISIIDEVQDELKRLIKEFPEIGDSAVAHVSDFARKYILDNYLSGQVLDLSNQHKGPFYSQKDKGVFKITGWVFNLFENGRRVVSNLSGTPIETGLRDQKRVLKPASEEIKPLVDKILRKFLEENKHLRAVLS